MRSGCLRYVRLAVTALFAVGLSMFPHTANAVCPTIQADLSTAITSAGAGGSIVLSCNTPTTLPFTAPITISQSVTLDASSSPAAITFDGQNMTQLFVVNSVSFTLKNVILTQGLGADQGGAIHSNAGTVTIGNSTLTANAMTGSSNTGGGAISSLGGTLSIDGSTFSGNHADKTGSFGSPGGGAIFIQGGTLTITNSTFSANSTTNPIDTNSGGAIYNQGGTLSIVGSTFVNNLGNFGGALWSQGPVTVSESTFSGNGGNFAQGGAIYTTTTTNPTLTIVNSTFYQNLGNDSIEVQSAGVAQIGGSIIANTSGGSGGATANPNCAAFGRLQP